MKLTACCADNFVPVSAAGNAVQLSFAIQNDGNVALRGLQLSSPSDLTTLTCTPALGDTSSLSAGSSATCHGSRAVQQEELEKVSNSYEITLQAANVDPTGATSTSQYSKLAALPAVQLPAVAAVQAQLVTTGCQKPFKARECYSSCQEQAYSMLALSFRVWCLLIMQCMHA